MTDGTTLEPIRCAVSDTDPETYEVRRVRDNRLLATFDISEDHGMVLAQMLLGAIYAVATGVTAGDATIN